MQRALPGAGAGAGAAGARLGAVRGVTAPSRGRRGDCGLRRARVGTALRAAGSERGASTAPLAKRILEPNLRVGGFLIQVSLRNRFVRL